MNPFKLSLLLLLLLLSSTNSRPTPKPCKTLTFFLHDILFDGHNAHNATAAIVAAPAWANRSKLAILNHFGDLVIFDDPITLHNNLRSPAVGRAQGFYLYDKKDVFTAWYAFSMVFNSTEHRGTIQLIGADPFLNKTREVSVVGGTGDFLMARGVATLTTDAFEGEVYFRLMVDIRIYECYS
ncbi:disease resistance response protein 206-like [Phalaenopsis equestris]|uniref:disease resistance response protein 206-like n=1 Tax=Phalaenopsis equestris TaxID=78828 RepID=UPI0009E224C4|nr:disease resistance response protein 206-like [Phalaenopsis equestris]